MTPELRRRVDNLRSAMRRLEVDLERALAEADDLAGRGPVSRSAVVDALDVSHTAASEALEALEGET